MVLMYHHLAAMAETLSLPEKALGFAEKARSIGRRINQWCWHEAGRFY